MPGLTPPDPMTGMGGAKPPLLSHWAVGQQLHLQAADPFSRSGAQDQNLCRSEGLQPHQQVRHVSSKQTRDDVSGDNL